MQRHLRFHALRCKHVLPKLFLNTMHVNWDRADADGNVGQIPQTLITLAYAKDSITALLPEVGVGGRRVRRPRAAVRIVID